MDQMTKVRTFPDAIRAVRANETTVEAAVEELLAELTDGELLGLLDGDITVRSMTKLPGMIKSGAVGAAQIPRIGFPGVQFTDGPRGVVIEGSTAFPVSMARAATWDPDLEREVGHAMGLEGRAQGANYSGAVCINLLRHPSWGRAQESYGEDPVLTGRMGVGLTLGLRPNVMACVKHFALNSMENARFRVDVRVDDHALHEVYLPHFKAVIDAGAETVMSAYNSVNGKFMDVNKVLLTDVLRDEWGFEGFVTSDWVFGTHDGLESLEAGLDIEMPLSLLRARELPKALKDGRLDRETVLTSARRIVGTILRHAATRDEAEPSRSVVASAEHRALARKVAERSMVLLKNDPVGGVPVLPFSPTITRLAVIGALADQSNMGDRGSSLVHPPSSVTPLAGLHEALPDIDIEYADGSDLTAAAAAARRADAVVVVVGMDHDDEGERIENDDIDISFLGFPFTLAPVRWLLKKMPRKNTSQFGRGGDRESLTLHPGDERLVAAIAAANPRTTVVLIGGSAIIVEAWRQKVPAIVHAWYPGMEGGRALANVLTGAVEPGGRLPVAVPTDAAHLPFFDAEARTIVYDASWGQRKLDQDGHAAAFPFGFGLGYTTFEIELIDHSAAEENGTARVRVRNTGERLGSTVAQVYAVDTAAKRVVPQLVGFRRVELAPGAEAVVDVHLDLTPTRERDPQTRVWSRRPGTWAVVADAHSPSSTAGARRL
ncbi:glycoside hydrolase family 3 C-terminal domain-containing protein [Microbacterium sp. ARD31]|uniref:beta-glucosidase n=1 Tax=Microbacterium sp. ARD31 TaxID=2962576 RepID=UPI002882A1F2|nr:glycoside hydrolase family 3 C-terminal domain-containing protein [Microbacterium sp. ARD31]MDT0184026.1 glycoside hydrolase family 3 C-terminal domain-containing protein [Microbacterium sp. ARD31]